MLEGVRVCGGSLGWLLAAVLVSCAAIGAQAPAGSTPAEQTASVSPTHSSRCPTGCT